jgi:hypothetical protein
MHSQPIVGDLLYAEFTSLSGGYANFTGLCSRYPAHFELFNLTEDPHQLRNLYYRLGPAGEALKRNLAAMLQREFECVGGGCG